MMHYLGEILALIVAVLWTISSLASESASRKYGSLLLNIVRMLETIVFLMLLLWVMTGSPFPRLTTGGVWCYLGLSSLTGYIIGDYFFLLCFILIGARWGELFMTVAPPAAALTGWLLLGEEMTWLSLLGMAITMFGICLSVLSKQEDNAGRGRIGVKLPLRGILYGLLAGIGQGVGLVFSKQAMILYRAHIYMEQGEGSSFLTAMPFAATLIRCLVALVGFVVMYALFRRTGRDEHSPRLLLTDRRALGLASLSALTGPCIGVSLSLAATMYTSTGVTQTIMSLVPVLILWPSHLLFHSKITFREVVGAVISVIGVALFFV